MTTGAAWQMPCFCSCEDSTGTRMPTCAHAQHLT